MPRSDTAPVYWTVEWENDIPLARHTTLAAMLARIYPQHSESFTGTHSWSGARPEVRIIGSKDDRPIAHLGLLRRFLRVPERGLNILVGDVGLVGIDPDFRGKGLGKILLKQTKLLMTDLKLPYGFLTCRPEVVPFYKSGGWWTIEGQTTRMIDNDHLPEDYTGPAMVLSVHSSRFDWPEHCVVVRNGLEV